MFNDLLGTSANILLVNRLNRIASSISADTFSTEEEYQAAIYSAVNAIVNLGNSMTPLTPIVANTPAIVGTFSTNLVNINNDNSDILTELQSIETDAARLFNLGEASQNSIRQLIREAIYANTSNYFTEPFINGNNYTTTGSVDYSAARAFLPIVSTTQLKPNFNLGIASVGSTTYPINQLNQNVPTALFSWTGSVLEVVCSFPSATIVNRVVIVLDDYWSI
jgi:hypothetical protein